jgi:hypothetical protein
MDTAKVGVREFRDQLGTYLESDKPVAVTKHGRTVGFYIPTRGRPDLEDIAALQEAGRTLDAWLRERGLSEEELVAEFDQLRKAGRKRGG